MADDPGTASPPDIVDIDAYMLGERERVDAALDRLLLAEDVPPATLHRAMRYSVFAGGKRLRPILVIAAGSACGAEPSTLLPAACAVELIHTYSLIHDDLPAFDDDDLRRGKPTSHVVFGEAVAILAGDALQAMAFGHLAEQAWRAEDPQPWVATLRELAAAAGSTGMVGGQCQDLEAEGATLDIEELRQLHGAKTGALLSASVRMGALVAGADRAELEALSTYGSAVGLAFQIVDDILDVEGSVHDLGKRPGSDADRRKSTYPAVIGIDRARDEARGLRDRAAAAVAALGGRGSHLAALARFIVERSR